MIYIDSEFVLHITNPTRPPDKSVYWKTIFFISHPKHMFKLMGKEINTIYPHKISLSGSMSNPYPTVLKQHLLNILHFPNAQNVWVF